MKIHKGDIVKVLAGRDRGKSGKVLEAFPKLERVVVEGVNKVKKHERARKANQKGQVVERAMPIHISNVALVKA
ncbi:MAG: 50S ribosomal protein L24 [Parcubacteria group bacterium Gr01-1014_17]|nr:MAG: 50S ribosomal protein L24 [Parcubacteria group bacterium Gr01-1014_17]